jgi:hypothetical protein
MHKSSTRVALLVVIALAVVVLVLSTAAVNPVMGEIPKANAVPPRQGATPTPTEAPASQAGSTDGIMLMGSVIVAIVLLPILTRKALWH